jgi:hypothetical protein
MIEDILQLPFSQMRKDSNMQVLADFYKKEFNKEVCTSCPADVKAMIQQLQRYFKVSNFEIQGNKYYRISKRDGKTINNNIITDELAIEFLKEDSSRIKLFSKYPVNWLKMLEDEDEYDADGQVVEEEKEEDTEEVKEYKEDSRIELEQYKLKELRELYPDIKAVAKADFIDKVLK